MYLKGKISTCHLFIYSTTIHYTYFYFVYSLSLKSIQNIIPLYPSHLIPPRLEASLVFVGCRVEGLLDLKEVKVGLRTPPLVGKDTFGVWSFSTTEGSVPRTIPSTERYGGWGRGFEKSRSLSRRDQDGRTWDNSFR